MKIATIHAEYVAGTDKEVSDTLDDEEIAQERRRLLSEEIKHLERDERFDVFSNRAGLHMSTEYKLRGQRLTSVENEVKALREELN
ncbi:hypothetical protein MMC28_004028 [Mycoblastus sanguinarius]|nr:hypothetical protein [Mycoblastus sanguinarius]